MSKKYVIEGGKKLEGTTYVSGSKNASLPIIAASLLNGGVNKLYNVPNIHDTQMMFKILETLGCKIKKGNGKIIVDSKNVENYEIPENLMREMRSSVIIAGALLARKKKVIFTYPGGCDIGSRPIDLHIKSFEKLGIKVKEESGYITCEADEIIGNDIHLDFPSVGATENIMMASCMAKGITNIHNAAMEPEIVDLQNALNSMGAKIYGAGTNNIIIKGVEKLKDLSYNIIPDRIEAGTLLCAVAITGGNIKLQKVIPEHIKTLLNKLEEMGCDIKVDKNEVILKAPKKLRAVDIKTLPYPGFPTDLQSILGVTLTVAKGTSVIVENIFENRYKYLSELTKMGAKSTIEGRTAVIKGVRKLNSANVRSTDLRGGAAMVIAGLNAKGRTCIDNIEYILRGYEKLDLKLKSLGADIYIIEDKN